MNHLALIILLCFLSILAVGQTADYYLYVGTYTHKISEGIYASRFNSQTGNFTPINIAKNIKNPTFLAISIDQCFLYASNHVHDGLATFSINQKTGRLSLVAIKQSMEKLYAISRLTPPEISVSMLVCLKFIP